MKSLFLVLALVVIAKGTLPDCTGCYAPSTGQCKSTAGVCYPASGDVCPAGTEPCGASTKYACDHGSCSESSTGSYDSLSACQSDCATKTWYSCSNGECSEDASGSYSSLSACKMSCGSSAGKVVGLYYADWAKYRTSPYKYDASNIAPIVGSVTDIYYGFSFFCPPSDQPKPYWYSADCASKAPFELTTIDPTDEKNIQTIVGYKSQNPNLKVIAAIGGWTFPSSFFSAAVKSANRASFIASIKQFINQYKFDGLNIDWEYPCSQPRTDHVKITCTDIKPVTDQGGDCPSGTFAHGYCTGTCADGANLLAFLQELKQEMPNLLVSIAQSANPANIKLLPISDMDKVLDHWNLMNYDFFVSDIASQSTTAPNQNLYTVESLGVENWSASDAIDAMLSAGATPSKILFGVSYYGHTYQIGSKSDDSWQAFNVPAQIEGQCCGAFQQTYGGKPGKGSQQCGTLMYSEIVAAGFESYYDSATESMIGYLKSEGKDGSTPAGTWISYLDKTAIQNQVNYAMGKGLGGAFAWDITMDSIENGQFTYELTHQMSDSVFGK